jgi:ATP-dependent helicase/nuclease subunit B
MDREANRLASELARVARERPLGEKWLIAPSLRIAQQWLVAAARTGTPVINVRAVTLPGLALELAGAAMTRSGRSYLGPAQAQLIIGEVLGRMARTYLSRLPISPGLVRGLAASMRDLRLAGADPDALRPAAFEPAEKGRELQAILRAYEARLAELGLIDYAGALRLAAERLAGDAQALPAELTVLMPEDGERELRGLEKKFWEAFPAALRRVLPIDRPGGSAGDGSVELFRAVGEVNEVREVLRRCGERGIAWDEVELVSSDADTYGPLLFELGAGLAAEPGSDPPVTFGEGIPARFFRPARALLGWVAWRTEFAPRELTRMVREGLLRTPADGPGAATLAAVLRSLAIGPGRERYLPALDAARGAAADGGDEDGGDEGAARPGDPAVRRRALATLRPLVADLVELSAPAGPRELIESAAGFLERCARSEGRLDEYTRHSLLRDIRELLALLPAGEVPGFDAMSWLTDLALVSRVGGLGPRPGCIHVSSLGNGGHSGRRYTFIIGLDDTRHPGAGRQDPLLLDQERRALSRELPTAAGRLARAERDFAELLARLRGNVTLSYCCRDLRDDRELFPSPALIASYRLISGEREGSLAEMTRWLGPPASFAPARLERCRDMNEWWLTRLTGDEGVRAEAAVAARFPHLARGWRARDARASEEFTEYDGYVPEAGAEGDPRRPDGPAVSASRLETLGTCPLEYFFRYGLGIEPVEDAVADPGRWLLPADRGGVLHEVFREYMLALAGEGRRPDAADRERIEGLLRRKLEDRARAGAPPNPAAYERDWREMAEMVRIFLRWEEDHCRSAEPCYFETALGMEQAGAPTALDSRAPVRIELPGGAVIRGRGRIDRIDRGPGGPERYQVWDYKTGSAWKFRQGPPFWAGRCIQSAFYLALVEQRLREVHPGARVDEFGYFFPTQNEHGERIRWSAEELADGRQVIADLCATLAQGAFIISDVEEDLNFSGYRAAFGDVKEACRAARRKLANPANHPLARLRELRAKKPGGRG